MKVFAGPAELAESVGAEIGASDWLVIGQDRIDQFAEATGDHQWIHVDAARAKEGPFGSTIAHGFLTLSLLPALLAEVYRVEGVRMGINYGLNRVRFINPVRVGSSVRAVMTVADPRSHAWRALARWKRRFHLPLPPSSRSSSSSAPRWGGSPRSSPAMDAPRRR